MSEGQNADLSNVTNFPATSAPLIASSFLIDRECRPINDIFMRCRQSHEDPAKCLQQAQSVYDCTMGLFRKIAASKCQPLFEKYWRCLDMNNQNFIYCREEEFDFFRCTRSELGMEKRLWLGSGPKDGFKEADKRPELTSRRFRAHVWMNKNGDY